MAQQYGSLNVVRIRASSLEESGAPNEGGVAVVTKNVTSIDMALEISDGEEIEITNADGDLCVSRKDLDKVKRATLTTSFCELDYDLVQLLAGGTLHTDGGETIGYSIPKPNDPAPAPVCFEAWTIAWEQTGQALDAGQNPRFMHWVFPFCRFRLDDTTLEKGAASFGVVGTSDENDLLTTNGPFDDWPAAITGEDIAAPVNNFLDIVVPTVVGSTTVPVQA